MEMTLDWFGDYKSPCVDCANTDNTPDPGMNITMRGGSWYDDGVFMGATTRVIPAGTRENSSITKGVRCARDWPPDEMGVQVLPRSM